MSPDVPTPRTILVVDDDAIVLRVVARILKNAGFSPRALTSSREALTVLAEEPPALLLLDLLMPEPDGFAVLAHLRSRPATQKLPVIVLTAVDGEGELARVFDAGADDYLRKPFSPVELVARIRSQLQLRSVLDTLAKKERDAQLVLDLTRDLASSLDIEEILGAVARRLAELAQVERVGIVLVHERTDIGQLVVVDRDDVSNLPLHLRAYPDLTQALADRQMCVVEHAREHPLAELVRRAGRDEPVLSLAIIPMLPDDNPLGALLLGAREEGAFGPHELALCNMVAGATAIALRNARVLQSLRDETEQETVARFEAERRIRTLQRYADFFDSAGDGIIVLDSDGRLLFSNARALDITGYARDELRGRRVSDLFTNDDASVDSILRDFASGSLRGHVDLGLRRPDGSERTLSTTFNSVLREEGAVVCSFRDVTVDRAVESELVKTKDFLQRVIDSSVDAVVSADLQGSVLLVNRAAERLFGRPVEELVGSMVAELFADERADEVFHAVVAGDGRAEGIAADIVDSIARRVPVTVSATLLHEGERAVGWVAILTDQRERVAMQERLRSAQERLVDQERKSAVAELAGAAAHELNQPLTSVLGYAELLRRRLPVGSPGSEAAEVIAHEAQRLAEIVRKIGNIVRYETKSYVGQARIVDLDRASTEGRGSGEKGGQ